MVGKLFTLSALSMGWFGLPDISTVPRFKKRLDPVRMRYLW